MWANPFGLAPSMGLLFPFGINFLEKISACITEVSAAASEIAATSGVALIWRVFTVSWHCLPREPEFEAGLMFCSSALKVDGKLPVDIGLNVEDDPEKMAAASLGYTPMNSPKPLNAAQLEAQEFLDMEAGRDAAVAARLSRPTDSSAVSQLGQGLH